MAFSFIASAASDTSAGPLNVVAGDLLVAWLAWETNSANPGLSDGGSNVFTTTSIINNTDNFNWGRFAYKINAAANSSANFSNPRTTGLYNRITVFQFRPDSGETVSLDFTTSGTQGNTSSFITNSFSSTGTDEVIVVGMKNWAGNEFSSAVIDGDVVDGINNTLSYSAAGYWLKTATVSNVTATVTTNNDYWVGMAIGFKSVAAGSTSLIPPSPASRYSHLLVR